ncbi:MAG TPA: BON domain-containing protein [Acidobacteriota bacterium]|jgi:hyperosmotically inducible protein|nr:BON domain-containing protein [Acidobacteriota bacterium]
MRVFLRFKESATSQVVYWVFSLVFLAAVAGVPALARNKHGQSRNEGRLVEEVRHQLVTLPWYGVFDNLEYQVRGDTVILSGQVTRPTLKSDAEARVKRLEEVSRVINNIEVLPLSPNDDRIRIATYRAIFSQPGLDRYAMMAVPPIHIIVKNGNLTLVGVVATEGDKNQAGIIARTVSGVFSVTNDLRVEK